MGGFIPLVSFWFRHCLWATDSETARDLRARGGSDSINSQPASSWRRLQQVRDAHSLAEHCIALSHTLSLSLNKSCRRRFWHCSCHRHANWLRRGLTTQQQTDGRTAPSSLFWRPAAVCFLHLLDWLEVAFSGRQMASLVSFEPNTWQVCAYSSTMSFTL